MTEPSAYVVAHDPVDGDAGGQFALHFAGFGQARDGRPDPVIAALTRLRYLIYGHGGGESLVTSDGAMRTPVQEAIWDWEELRDVPGKTTGARFALADAPDRTYADGLLGDWLDQDGGLGPYVLILRQGYVQDHQSGELVAPRLHVVMRTDRSVCHLRVCQETWGLMALAPTVRVQAYAGRSWWGEPRNLEGEASAARLQPITLPLDRVRGLIALARGVVDDGSYIAYAASDTCGIFPGTFERDPRPSMEGQQAARRYVDSLGVPDLGALLLEEISPRG